VVQYAKNIHQDIICMNAFLRNRKLNSSTTFFRYQKLSSKTFVPEPEVEFENYRNRDFISKAFLRKPSSKRSVRNRKLYSKLYFRNRKLSSKPSFRNRKLSSKPSFRNRKQTCRKVDDEQRDAVDGRVGGVPSERGQRGGAEHTT
jgi:hypothetical protein